MAEQKNRFGRSDRTMIDEASGHVRLNFDYQSIEDFLEVCQEGRDSIDAGLPQGVLSDPNDGSGWSGGYRFEDFRYLLERGDFSESLEKFDEAMLEINQGIESTKVVYDVSGDAVDMGRYLSGVPENMATMVKTGDESPVVSIIVCISANSNVEASALCQRAAAIAGVIEWIRGTGIGVELFAVSSSSCSKFDLHQSVRVAASWENWDVQTVSMMCGHVSTFRNAFFHSHHTLSENAKDVFHLRGRSIDPDRFSIPEYASVRPCVIVGAHDGRHFDPLKMIESIRSIVDEGRLEDGSFPVVRL